MGWSWFSLLGQHGWGLNAWEVRSGHHHSFSNRTCARHPQPRRTKPKHAAPRPTHLKNVVLHIADLDGFAAVTVLLGLVGHQCLEPGPRRRSKAGLGVTFTASPCGDAIIHHVTSHQNGAFYCRAPKIILSERDLTSPWTGGWVRPHSVAAAPSIRRTRIPVARNLTLHSRTFIVSI